MMNFDRSRRLLFGALALTLLLHLLVLSGGGRHQPVSLLSSPPLQAYLVSPKPVEQQASVFAVPANPSVARPQSPASGAPRKALPSMARIEKPVPLREPGGASGPVTFADEAHGDRMAAPMFPAPAAEGMAPSTTPAAAASAAPPANAVSADVLRQYRIDLAVAARRFRAYPALARTRGWEGVSEVGLLLSPALSAPQVRLFRSSGHEILDEAALRMLSRAAAATPLPDGLRGADVELTLPIRFSLED
jgi:protein TonB